jgi:hypothetical protein
MIVTSYTCGHNSVIDEADDRPYVKLAAEHACDDCTRWTTNLRGPHAKAHFVKEEGSYVDRHPPRPEGKGQFQPRMTAGQWMAVNPQCEGPMAKFLLSLVLFLERLHERGVDLEAIPDGHLDFYVPCEACKSAGWTIAGYDKERYCSECFYIPARLHYVPR